MKETKRKAFNFLRSYFDVLNELKEDSDKLSFLMAIINKQFLNEDPIDLEFISKLCYESQRHSVESSVKGWIRVAKTDLKGNPLTNPPTIPMTNPKEVEEKEEVEVQEEEKVKYINNKEFSKNLISNQQWIETICMQQKIQIVEVQKYLDNFDQHLITSQTQHHYQKDYSAHFTNWISRQKKGKEKSSAKKESAAIILQRKHGLI